MTGKVAGLLLLAGATAPAVADTGTQLAAISTSDNLVAIADLVAMLETQEPQDHSAPQAPDRIPREPLRIRFGYDQQYDDIRLMEPESTFESLQPNGRMRDPATVFKLHLNRL